MTRKTTSLFLAVLLAAAVALPAGVAMAKPGAALHRVRAVNAQAGTARAAQRRVAKALGLRVRILRVLARRKVRFDRVSTRLSAQIARVTAISGKVAAAGGATGAADAQVKDGSDHLAKATSLEAEAVALFTAVPDASDKKAALAAARAKGAQAASELRQARLSVKSAVSTLIAVVGALKAK